MNEDFDYWMTCVLEKIEEDKEKIRPCEICSKDDLPTYVVSSSLVAMSNNICLCCSAMGAELDGMQDLFGDYLTFDKLSDSYKVKGQVYNIQVRDGSSFETRSEFVNHYKKLKDSK